VSSALAQVDFNSFLEKNYVDLGGYIILAVVVVGLAFGFTRWRGALSDLLKVGTTRLTAGTKTKVTLRSLAINVLYQKPVADCSRTRWAIHFSLFWGFVGLAIATTLDAILNPTAGPIPLLSPVRVAGNVGGALFMFGVTASLARRLALPVVRRNSSLGDFFFLGVLFVAGLTGFFTEFLAGTATQSLDFVIYWSHLLFVALLLVSAPFTKFIHAVGRPTILLVKNLAEAKSEPAN
jgi:nitrate reductase gamma subunit